MNIDWNALATIASPIFALFVGVWVNRKFENRPCLISYFSHVSAFKLTPSGGQAMGINTHTVVLRNTGRRSATGIRIHHNLLPDFNIWPIVAYSIDTLPDGTQDIVIPTLVPGEEITISYLYFHPITVGQVNAGIKWDQGFAQQITVLLQKQFPKWVNRILAFLVVTGAVAIVYVVYALISRAI